MFFFFFSPKFSVKWSLKEQIWVSLQNKNYCFGHLGSCRSESFWAGEWWWSWKCACHQKLERLKGICPVLCPGWWGTSTHTNVHALTQISCVKHPGCVSQPKYKAQVCVYQPTLKGLTLIWQGKSAALLSHWQRQRSRGRGDLCTNTGDPGYK